MMTLSLLAPTLSMILLGADWTQFRGPASSAVGQADAPVAFKDKGDARENVAWRVSLPGKGLSSPIVVGERVVVTCSSGPRQERLHIIAFDQGTGKEVWHRQFWSTGNTTCHPATSIAAPSPASDGKSIVALFSTNDVVCVDLDGNLKWYRGLTHDYPNASNSVGMASSPVVIGSTAIVQLESQSDSFALGLDLETGLNRWKIPRVKSANWTSPIPFGSDPTVVLLQGGNGLAAHDPTTGEKLWFYAKSCSTIPSAAADSDVVCVPSEGLTALRCQPNKKEPEIVWKSNRLSPTTPSPVIYHDRVFTVSSGPVLKCADLKTGEIVWQLRLKGKLSSTPVVAGDRLYCFNHDGLCQVVELGKEGKIVGTGELGEEILCTPAVAHGGLFVRSDGHLWKIAKPAAVAAR